MEFMNNVLFVIMIIFHSAAIIALFMAQIVVVSSWKPSSLKKSFAATCATFWISGFPPDFAIADNMKPAPWNKDIQYEVLQEAAADAAAPKTGDLVSIRFKGSFKGNTFDDTFKAELPYIYRAGVGTLLPGLDETVVNMKQGQKLHVSFGGNLGFGEKGRPSAPGKPRIPPNAVIDYEVLLEDLPGTQEDFIADAE